MPATQSAVMDTSVTGQATATTRRPAKKKAKVDTAEVRAQIKIERTILKDRKDGLKSTKTEMRSILSDGKKDVTAATKHLKLVTTGHLKDVKAVEKAVNADEKAVTKQQGIIDKLTAKLN